MSKKDKVICVNRKKPAREELDKPGIGCTSKKSVLNKQMQGHVRTKIG